MVRSRALERALRVDGSDWSERCRLDCRPYTYSVITESANEKNIKDVMGSFNILVVQFIC